MTANVVRDRIQTASAPHTERPARLTLVGQQRPSEAEDGK